MSRLAVWMRFLCDAEQIYSGEHGIKIWYDAMMTPLMGTGGVCVWWSLNLGGPFYVGGFGRNLTSVGVNIFLYFVYFKKKCYKLCTLNAICKYKAD